MDKKLDQDRPGNWDAEMAALHEKTAALGLYEFWSVGQQGEHEAVRDLTPGATSGVSRCWSRPAS